MHPQPSSLEPTVSFNQQSAKLWNRRLILQLLNSNEPLSRRQIAGRTGILTSTVAYIVRDLLDRGQLKVRGKGPATGVGRRNILLGINPDYGWGAGISLLHTHRVRVELINSGLRRLDATTFSVDAKPERLPGELARGLHDWLEERGRPPGRFFGVGVALPGIVDVRQNFVLRSMRFGYRDFPLGERLEELLGVPVRIERNADAGAHAENRYGCASSLDDFVYLLMNRSAHADGRPFYSYGASLYLSGSVYRGAYFAAGELDRTSMPSLDLTQAEAENLGATLADAEAELTPLSAELAKALGRYLVPVVDLLDPEALVLGGDCPLLNRQFLKLLEDWVQRQTISLQARRIRILHSRLTDTAVACGAALGIVESGLYGRELEEIGSSGGRDPAGCANAASPE